MNAEQFQRLVELLQCPIAQDGYLIGEPRVASDGNTYESEAIAQWLVRSQTSPLTREPLELITTRNRLAERIVELVREVDPSLRLSPCGSMVAFARAVRLGESLARFELSPLEFIAAADELSLAEKMAALPRLSTFEELGNHILHSIAQSAELTREYFRLGGSPIANGQPVGTATLPPDEHLTYAYFAQVRVAIDGLELSARARANYLCASQPDTEEDLRAADLDARLAAATLHEGPLFTDEELSTHRRRLQDVGYLSRLYARRIRDGLVPVDVNTISPDLLVWPITECSVPVGSGVEPLAFAFLSARRVSFIPDAGTVKLVHTTPSGKVETLAHRAHSIGFAGMAMAWLIASHPEFPINVGEPHITELLGDCPERHYGTVSLATGSWRRNVLLRYPHRYQEAADDLLLDAEFAIAPRVGPRSAERTMALLRNTRCDYRQIAAKDWAPATDEEAIELVNGWPGRLKLLSPELVKKAIVAYPAMFTLLPAATQKRLLKSADVVARLGAVDDTHLTPKTLELYLCARRALESASPTE